MDANRPPTVFTDEDIEQLKRLSISFDLSPRTDDFINYPANRITALLERLKAAENALELHINVCCVGMDIDKMHDKCAATEMWKRTSGKIASSR